MWYSPVAQVLSYSWNSSFCWVTLDRLHKQHDFVLLLWEETFLADTRTVAWINATHSFRHYVAPPCAVMASDGILCQNLNKSSLLGAHLRMLEQCFVTEPFRDTMQAQIKSISFQVLVLTSYYILVGWTFDQWSEYSSRLCNQARGPFLNSPKNFLGLFL